MSTKRLPAGYRLSFILPIPTPLWERGLNEYTNKLIRQYIPKKELFANYDEAFIKSVQHKLNRRPRKLLNFEASWKVFADVLNKSVALAT
jgi:IS30 family transposase